MSKTGLDRHIGESAIVVIVVKLAGMAFLGLQILGRRTRYQEDVHPTIVVKVEDRNPAAHGFHNVTFFPTAASEVKINAGGVSYVDERYRSRRRNFPPIIGSGLGQVIRDRKS